MDSVNESLEDLIKYEDGGNRSVRIRRSECPGGSGKFGFNSYNLLAFLLMSFNQVRISVFGLFVLNISVYNTIFFGLQGKKTGHVLMCHWNPIKDKKNETENTKNKKNFFLEISMFENSLSKNILSKNSSSGNTLFGNILSKKRLSGNILSKIAK